MSLSTSRIVVGSYARPRGDDALNPMKGRDMKKTSRDESGRIAAGLITVLVLIVLLGGVVWMYSSSRAASVRDTFRLVKDSSQDAATTTKVKTALLLSKHVSAFDTAVGTARGEVTLTGEVPTEEIKRLAAAIAQDTSGVTAVHNNLTVNPGVAGNPEVASIGDRVADLEIKTLVTDQLAQSPEVKDARITVQVSRRRVSLEGAVDSPAQRRAADRIALRVPGVQELSSNLVVTTAAGAPESPDDKLAHRVEFELYATKAVALKDVQIRSQDGSVFLGGKVGSRAEKLLAERVTQSVEGVKKVVNNLSAPEEQR
jgi:hyperosmotically inducible protein